MIFADLPAGEAIFLDANTLVYHFQPHPTFGSACNQLVTQIEQQQVVGYTSTHMLTEAAHRLMMIEAMAQFAWKLPKIKERLLKDPSKLKQLTRFRGAVNAVLQSQVRILSIPPLLIDTACTISQQTGLLSNDALTVAVMQANGLTNIASNDADFDRVPRLTRYGPG
jgi:predicted nucleic acid-binding protein